MGRVFDGDALRGLVDGVAGTVSFDRVVDEIVRVGVTIDSTACG